MRLLNPLLQLQALGQSVWLDYIERGFMNRGDLAVLICNDGLSGLTSNPSIFEQAIAQHKSYLPQIRRLARSGLQPYEIYEALAIEDVQRAADFLRGVYDSTDGREGLVSIEVSPRLARHSQGTVAEAKRLWTLIDRPNAMIKVPATLECLPAVRQLIADGINVNATLLFSPERYEKICGAFQSGIEERLAAGKEVRRVASVASFFVSRIDTLVDHRLESLGRIHALELRGRAAISCAQLIYESFGLAYSTPRWQALAARGARPQRLLWASMSTKNPGYKDVKYVEALIGASTVTALPLQTLSAYRDHGAPMARLGEGVDTARHCMSLLATLGFECATLVQQLEDEGIRTFAASFDALLATVAAKMGESAKHHCEEFQ